MVTEKHILMLGHGGSGTTVVFDHLLNNNKIFVHNHKEPLNINLKQNWELANNSITWKNHINNLLKLAEKQNQLLLIHATPSQILSFGTQIKDFVDLLSNDFNFILIKRLNYISLLSSLEFKKKRNRLLEEDFYKLTQVSIQPPRGIYNYIRWIDYSNKELESAVGNYKHLNIQYEKHINIKNGIKKTYNLITKYFGIYHSYEYNNCLYDLSDPLINKKGWDYHSSKNPWSNVPLKEKIKNFSEFEKELTNTEYGWMLNSV